MCHARDGPVEGKINSHRGWPFADEHAMLCRVPQDYVEAPVIYGE